MAIKFSLQSVLNYRHSKVESLEIEIGTLNQLYQKAQKTLCWMKTRLAELLEVLNEEQLGEVNLVRIRQVRSSIKRVESQITAQLVEIESLAEKIRAKQQEVIQAKQDEEVLEILKRKELERHKARLAQQEIQLQDDIYIAQGWRALQS